MSSRVLLKQEEVLCGNCPFQEMLKVESPYVFLQLSESYIVANSAICVQTAWGHGHPDVCCPGNCLQCVQCYAGSLKGFGFATFMTRGHAESAIKNTNGKVTHLGSTQAISCTTSLTWKQLVLPALKDRCCAAKHALACMPCKKLCMRRPLTCACITLPIVHA